MNLKNLNIAEGFSLSRIVTFPIVILLVVLEMREVVAWFYIIMFSTDFIDGFFAYFYNMEGKRRAQLDTLGDILYILAGLFGFYVFEHSFFVSHLFWILLIAFLYLIQFLISYFRFRQPSLFHTYLAKLATTFQVVFICFMFFFHANEIIFFIAIGFSVLEVIEEIVMAIRIKKWKENVKGWWDMDKKNEGT